MLRQSRTAVSAALALALLACGGNDDNSDAKGQTSLEVYAELQQSGVGGISQMPDGRRSGADHCRDGQPQVRADAGALDAEIAVRAVRDDLDAGSAIGTDRDEVRRLAA